MSKGILFSCQAPYQGQKIFFGDLHGHTADSYDVKLPDDGAVPINDGPEDALAYALDPQGGDLDFIAFTDHAEAFRLSPGWSEKDITQRYQEMLKLCAQQERIGNIVIFPGFEYSNSQFPGENSYGFGNKHIICRHHSVAAPRPIPCPDTANKSSRIARNIGEAWAELDDSAAAGNYISVPHHPARGILYEDGNTYFMASDWSEHGVDARRMPLVEMYSLNGNSEMPDGEEPVKGILEDYIVEVALGCWLLPPHNPAYKLGFIASTDNHIARPGYVDRLGNLPKPYDTRKLYGGYAAIWAPEHTNDSLWEGMLRRHTYATSGARIMLAATLSWEEKQIMMGETLQRKRASRAPLTLQIEAAPDILATNEDGTSVGIHHVEIFRQTLHQTECIKLYPPGFEEIDPVSGKIKVRWEDESSNFTRAIYRVKIFQNPVPVIQQMLQEGKLNEELYCPFHRAWSSPFWVEE